MQPSQPSFDSKYRASKRRAGKNGTRNVGPKLDAMTVKKCHIVKSVLQSVA